mmetsp:Transcript_14839/g.38628  ORF Transcript_14839/g.38628 Transcript_14839/m.38628 type:complete len:232 (-) Transcript_14839:418-1113(-)
MYAQMCWRTRLTCSSDCGYGSSLAATSCADSSAMSLRTRARFSLLLSCSVPVSKEALWACQGSCCLPGPGCIGRRGSSDPSPRGRTGVPTAIACGWVAFRLWTSEGGWRPPSSWPAMLGMFMRLVASRLTDSCGRACRAWGARLRYPPRLRAIRCWNRALMELDVRFGSTCSSSVQCSFRKLLPWLSTMKSSASVQSSAGGSCEDPASGLGMGGTAAAAHGNCCAACASAE